jgi:hypothetical protein
MHQIINGAYENKRYIFRGKNPTHQLFVTNFMIPQITARSNAMWKYN